MHQKNQMLESNFAVLGSIKTEHDAQQNYKLIPKCQNLSNITKKLCGSLITSYQLQVTPKDHIFKIALIAYFTVLHFKPWSILLMSFLFLSVIYGIIMSQTTIKLARNIIWSNMQLLYL